MEYRPRIVDSVLAARLRAVPMVLIEGARGTGKTAAARQLAASEVRFDVDSDARSLADIDPAAVIDGAVPRLFDEWQHAPAIWNHLRHVADERQRPGQFILTGSAVATDDAMRHSGAGRVSRIRLRPMTLFETGRSSGKASLGAMLSGQGVSGRAAGADLIALTELLCRGGWPAVIDAPIADAAQYGRDYLNEIRRTDIPQATGRRRDPAAMQRLLRSIARNTATEASIESLAADAGGDRPIAVDSVRAYLDALEIVYVAEDQPAWSVRLRSRSRLRRSPKRHFIDPSLAVAALGTGPDRLIRDLELLGHLFESLVVRDLRVYASAHGAQVFHYRDNTGLEADAIVETFDGNWIAAEAKLGGDKAIDEGARSLLRLHERIDTDAAGEPRQLAVVTAVGDYSYIRPDGVAVVPITALGP